MDDRFGSASLVRRRTEYCYQGLNFTGYIGSFTSSDELQLPILSMSGTFSCVRIGEKALSHFNHLYWQQIVSPKRINSFRFATRVIVWAMSISL
jgi:hypothetical protein